MVKCKFGKNLLNNFICHLSWFKNPHSYTYIVFIHEFSRPYELLSFELESFIKRLNVNCIKIHSIILSVTCHGLRSSIPCRSDFDLLD